MDAEVIKSYFVRLGWQVDNTELQRFEGTLRQVQGEVERHVSTIAPAFVKVAGAITAAYAAIGTATVGLVHNVAQAELGYQLLATKMYVSVDAAKKMSIAMSALGHSMEEIFWSPELRERYRELLEDQTRLQAELGIEYPQRMRQIRDVSFEFTRLRVELQYLAMALVQSVAKAFGTDTEGLLRRLRDFNNWLITHLPEAADKIANVLVPVLRDTWSVLQDMYQVGKDVIELFINLWQALGGDPEGRIKKQNSDLQNFAIVLQEISRAIRNITDSIAGLKDALAVVPGAILGAEFFGGLGTGLGGPVGGLIGALLGALAGGSLSKGLVERHKSLPAAPTAYDSTSAADKARELAKRVSAQTGVAADWIFAQWAHETDNFTSNVFRKYHNLAGIRVGGQYQNFSSMDESADRYAQVLSLPRYASARGAHSASDFAYALKMGGYYEDKYANYIRGMQRFLPASGGNTYVGGVQVHVTQPGASAEEIYQATVRAIDDKLGKGNQRLLAEYSGAYTY